MSKKLILFFVAVVFFSKVNSAQAGLVFTEIMYNPTGTYSQWVELLNNGTDAVQIKSGSSGWRFDDQSSSQHLINDTISVPPQSYVVLASNKTEFLSQYTNFVGLIADTSMYLNTTGLTLKVLDAKDGNIQASVLYNPLIGGNNDGNSLQLINDSWIAATPTPGAVNQAGTIAPPATISGGGLVSAGVDINPSTFTTAATSSKTKIVEESKKPEIKTQITGKTFSFVGIPISLEGTAFGLSGEQLHFGKYFWNFGDGDSKEIDLIDAIEPLNHTYFYPGDYVVSLDYFQNHYSNVSDASNQITIKIIPADIIISKVGDEKDFFVELSNNTDYNADLSNLILASDLKSFKIPHNTILSAKKKIIISPKITNFSIADKNTLKLMNGEGRVMFDYGVSIAPTETVAENLPAVEPLQAKTLISEVKNVKNSAITEKLTENSVVLPIDEAASVGSIGVLGQSADNAQSSPFIPIVSVVFIGASAYGVYFIRQKRIVPQNGNDFEVLDE
jgi:hypothetical protein